MLRLVCACAAALALLPSRAFPAQKFDVALRGQTLTLEVYAPQGTQAGTVFMASGDVGWVGLATTMAEDLAGQGFLVVGINARQYLSAFTTKTGHLEPADVPRDFRTMRDALNRQRALPRPTIVSGVSEGAALAVLAGSDAGNHDWIDGVITMGLPPTAELAWRWSDVSSWITKRDPDEPSFAPASVLASVSPVPLAMIQSTKDEYVSEADYRKLLDVAREPKRQFLIAAGNHRFTDKLPELRTAYDAALRWVMTARAGRGGAK